MPWATIALISLSLAAAPVCWTRYQVLQYPGIALLPIHAIRRRDWGMTAAASPVTLSIGISISPFACLGLFGLALSK